VDKLVHGGNIKKLEKKFHSDMLEGSQLAKKLGYNPTYFLRMVSDIGGVQAAKQLIKADKPSDGFTTLWELGRLDLSVEAHVLKLEYEILFSDEERQTCLHRLEAYGYKPVIS